MTWVGTWARSWGQQPWRSNVLGLTAPSPPGPPLRANHELLTLRWRMDTLLLRRIQGILIHNQVRYAAYAGRCHEASCIASQPCPCGCLHSDTPRAVVTQCWQVRDIQPYRGLSKPKRLPKIGKYGVTHRLLDPLQSFVAAPLIRNFCIGSRRIENDWLEGFLRFLPLWLVFL